MASCIGPRPVLVALAIALTALARAVVPASAAAPAGPELSATASPGELIYGARVTVTGRAGEAAGPAAGAPIALQGDPYPYRGFVTLAHAVSGPDGSFSFTGLRPDRNTRLRVLLEGPSAAMSPEMEIFVEPAVALAARRLGPGRTRLSMRVRHILGGATRPVSVRWFVAARGSSRFHLAATTSSSELGAGLTYASATIDPPSRRFLYRVCMNPPWEAAMGPPALHGPCPDHDFILRDGHA